MPKEVFRFCPNCGAEQASATPSLRRNRFECHSCHFVFYQNVAATASMILKCGNEFLLSVRAQEPSKGLLDFPGGFVDPGESVEEAFFREMEEELGWCPEQFQYAFSFPNTYLYQDLEYQTSDIFYFHEIAEKPALTPRDDVQEVCWIRLVDLDERNLAFESVKMAVAQLRDIFGAEQ